MIASFQDSEAAWQIRSEIDGRLRIFHPGLSNSLGLRRHCSSVLHRTHWLISHRINVVSSTVVIRFPLGQREQLISLLARCFIDPFSDQGLESTLSQDNQITDVVERPSFRKAIRNGAICASVLAVDSLFVLPPFSLAAVATVLSWPLLRHAVHACRKRLAGDPAATESLLSASVDLTLSTTLIGSGLARESLVEGLMENSTNALSALSENPDGRSQEFYDFVGRLKRNILIKPANASTDLPNKPDLALGDVEVGQLYNIQPKSHVFLHSKLIEGELIVVNVLVDGSTLPFKLLPGDEIEFGTSVLQGEALCEVLHPFSDSAILTIQESDATASTSAADENSFQGLYRVLSSPLQLGFGVWSLLNGLTERAIAVLGFDPFKDIESSKLSSGETALVDMALNQVHMNDARIMSSLSELDHVLFSINALRHMGTFELIEESLAPGCAKDELIQMLYSIAVALNADLSIVFWGVLADLNLKPLPVSFLKVSAGWLCHSTYVASFDGQAPVTIVFQHENTIKAIEHPSHDIKLIFKTADASLGHLLIRWTADHALTDVIQQLHALDVKTEVVGDFHADGSKEPVLRRERVMALKQQGAKVAYLGDVIDDIPAMASADLAIGLSDDETGFISKTVCDLILGGDLMWLSRLIVLSRRYVSATDFNASMIFVSSAATSLATFFMILTPLQSIVLFNFAPIAAEINTLLSLDSSASRLN